MSTPSEIASGGIDNRRKREGEVEENSNKKVRIVGAIAGADRENSSHYSDTDTDSDCDCKTRVPTGDEIHQLRARFKLKQGSIKGTLEELKDLYYQVSCLVYPVDDIIKGLRAAKNRIEVLETELTSQKSTNRLIWAERNYLRTRVNILKRDLEVTKETLEKRAQEETVAANTEESRKGETAEVSQDSTIP